MKQSIETIEEFDNILSTFWTEYNVLVWNINKSFQSFVGSELLEFITHIDVIVNFLKLKFVETNTLKCLCEGLLLWQKITPFLVQTTVEDKDKYKNDLMKFKEHLELFYEQGKLTFLTKNPATVGDDETFYLHCLRYLSFVNYNRVFNTCDV